MAFPSRLSAMRIADAALEIVEQEGFAQLGVRRLADRLGVRAPSLYRYVPSLESLQQTVAQQAAERLVARLDTTAADSPEAHTPAQLAAVMWTYVLWAEEHSGLYDALTATWGGFGAADHPVAQRIAHAVNATLGRRADRHAANTIWAMLHGFVLLSRGRLGPDEPDAAARTSSAADMDTLERAVVALLKGL